MDQLRAIDFEPRHGGALNWIDQADESGCVVVEFMGREFPKTPPAQQRWLIEQLREVSHQGFFFLTLAHRGLNLDFQLLNQRKLGRFHLVQGKVPLPQLFLLPNIDPTAELGQIKEFFLWVDDLRQKHGQDGREATIQWFRGGYTNRGLEWAGLAPSAPSDMLDNQLQLWRNKDWFYNWYRANLKGLGKLRMGPHCWLSMPSLVPDRYYAKLSEDILAKSPRQGV